ncbi:thioesterase family protein [Pseudophaeobacter leonis]|uniref:thioesterase family protein n=1 Tax=Pseudophaeobacter leonis TaxID=1144477 RepID=UPI0009F28B21|nr:thioesterase family protein [Pseudophaeobacter leonis]
MTTTPIDGHDGPYPAPIAVDAQQVLPEWIDYNGHMNVGYYGVAFGRAIEQIFVAHIGNGERHVRASGQGLYVLQSQFQFLRELKVGQAFEVSFLLIDHDHKRVHFWSELSVEGQVCATQEVLAMHVHHKSARSVAFPAWLQRRLARLLADHAPLPRPSQLGASLGIRRG